jgi:hypothetical protein
LKDKVFREFLRVRPLKSDLAVVEPFKPGRGGFAYVRSRSESSKVIGTPIATAQ